MLMATNVPDILRALSVNHSPRLIEAGAHRSPSGNPTSIRETDYDTELPEAQAPDHAPVVRFTKQILAHSSIVTTFSGRGY